MLKPYFQEELIEAGCDEAGRGCLAGPVFAAAVILPQNFFHPALNDSKQLSEKDRYELRDIIIENALDWAVGEVGHEEIDRINIFRASFKAMHLALNKLNKKPQLIIVDGNHFIPYKRIPYQTIIKGDGLYTSIAAASILAKTFRDDHMIEMDRIYPQYKWLSNKGYATAEHRSAIFKNGMSPIHRKSFRCLPEVGQAELEF